MTIRDNLNSTLVNNGEVGQPSDLAAIIFDFDGIFIDTEHLKMQSYLQCLTAANSPYKVTVPGGWEEYRTVHPVGYSRPEVCQWVINHFRLGDRAKFRSKLLFDVYSKAQQSAESFELKLFQELRVKFMPCNEWVPWKAIAFDRGILYEKIKDQAPAIPQAKTFLEAVRKCVAKIGLVTYTQRVPTINQLHRIGIAPESFDYLLCEDDLDVTEVTKKLMYEKICWHLAVEPHAAMAVEDTDNGVRSAKDAGIGFVVAAPTRQTLIDKDFLEVGADIVVSNLTVLLSDPIRCLNAH